MSPQRYANSFDISNLVRDKKEKRPQKKKNSFSLFWGLFLFVILDNASLRLCRNVLYRLIAHFQNNVCSQTHNA